MTARSRQTAGATADRTLPIRPLVRLWPLSPTAPSVGGDQLSRSAGRSVPGMEAGDLCADDRLIAPTP